MVIDVLYCTYRSIYLNIRCDKTRDSTEIYCDIVYCLYIYLIREVVRAMTCVSFLYCVYFAYG